MTFTVLSSNRVEILQARLAQIIADDPLTDPFARETVVVPSYAMARWLNLRLAQEHGIAANIFYPQAGEWIWQLAAGVLEDLPPRDPYSRESLGWQIFARLPDLIGDEGFAPLRRYLENDRSGIQRWQLARRIGDNFDRYQAFRPELIRAWSRGDDEHWQARLWRSLVEHRARPHRVATIERLIQRIDSAAAKLPRRVSLFAPSSLPPLYLEVFRAVAGHSEVCVYLHSPSDQYWADLESEKRRAKRRLAQPQPGSAVADDHQLIAAWGRQGQVFQDLLLQGAGEEMIDIDLYRPPAANTLLGALQRSIFDLAQLPPELPADESISVHSCHSPRRECEVLADALLDLLEHDHGVAAEDILVMVPDIRAYAPYIEARFRQLRLGFNISDTAITDERPLISTFLQLLGLPRSRFGSNEILTLLDNESLCRRFDLQAADRAEIRRLIERAHTRWGIDGRHRAELELPATEDNTWQQTRERFFAGFALHDDSLWRGLAPLGGCDESSLGAIGRFWQLFDRLLSWRRRLRAAQDAGAWRALLGRLVEDFFSEADTRDSQLQQIRDAVNRIETDSSEPLTPEFVSYLLGQLLAANEHSGQLYSGGITFCGMRPMRSIPFKVICLLGMNHADFPRRDPPNDFELLSRERFAGDPSKRSEDRYLMLETLLCARQRLYFSYCGRSLGDNSPQPPSPVLQELLDFIDQAAAPGEPPPSRRLLREHPLQAFAAANFSAARSYDDYWCAVANRLADETPAATARWPSHELDESDAGDAIDLIQLQSFVRHPVRYFFRQRLGIYLELEEPPQDSENFDLDGLGLWKLKRDLARATLERRSDADERIAASGLLGHGYAAHSQLEHARQAQADWFERLRDYAGIDPEPIALHLQLDQQILLHGTLGEYYPGRGLMAYHAGSFKGSQLLQLWVAHLALGATGRQREDQPSLLLAADQAWKLAPLAPATARARLADLCRLYRAGLRAPLPVLPDSSYAWISAADRDKGYARALRLWQNKWIRNLGDRGDAYLALVLRRMQKLPLAEAEFENHARSLYAGVLDAGEKI